MYISSLAKHKSDMQKKTDKKNNLTQYCKESLSLVGYGKQLLKKQSLIIFRQI